LTGAGSSLLARHLAGHDLTPGQAIKAKCAECMGNYADGRISCENPKCPLWMYMPYNPNRKRRLNPGRNGLKPGEHSSKLREVDNVSGNAEAIDE